jgi:hypothetical protein
MRVFSEMNFLIDDHDEFVKSLAPKADMLQKEERDPF